MGRYFNPPTPEALDAAGARLITIRAHPTMVASLNPGERLAVFLDRHAFRQVADVTDPAEFADFQEIVGAGLARPLGLYAIPAEAFKD